MKSFFDKAVQTVSDLGSSTRSLIESPLHDIDGIRPLLARAGFTLRAIEIELGITPQLIVAIQRDGGDIEDLEAIAEDHDLTATQRALIAGLRKAFSLEELALRNNFRVGGLKLGIGLPPSVAIILAPIDQSNAAAFAAAEPELAIEAAAAAAPTVRSRAARAAAISQPLPIQEARDPAASSSSSSSVPLSRREKRKAKKKAKDPNLHGGGSSSGMAMGCLFLIAALALIAYLLMALEVF